MEITPSCSIKEFQEFIKNIYGAANDRNFELSEMLNNILRFAMRGLKGIRKQDPKKAKENLIISFGWFISTLNRLHIDLEDEVWKRFPYLCSYCGACPCICQIQYIEKRRPVVRDDTKKPKTLEEFQKMFNAIYPAPYRSVDHAGVHFAEETGEFSESLIAYRLEKKEEDFKEVLLEAADYFSCLVGVFNSLKLNVAQELALIFSKNCHECHEVPCMCNYTTIKKYKS